MARRKPSLRAIVPNQEKPNFLLHQILEDHDFSPLNQEGEKYLILENYIDEKKEITTYDLPCGKVRVIDAELDLFEKLPKTFYRKVPDFTINQDKYLSDLEWLSWAKKEYPKVIAFYLAIGNHYIDDNNKEGGMKNVADFVEMLPDSPISLVCWLKLHITEFKTEEDLNKNWNVFFKKGYNLHDIFPKKKYFYKNEVIDFYTIIAGKEANNNNINKAEQYLNFLLKLNSNPTIALKQVERDILLSKIPTWKKYFYLLLGASAIIGLVWGVFKLVQWLYHLVF